MLQLFVSHTLCKDQYKPGKPDRVEQTPQALCFNWSSCDVCLWAATQAQRKLSGIQSELQAGGPRVFWDRFLNATDKYIYGLVPDVRHRINFNWKYTWYYSQRGNEPDTPSWGEHYFLEHFGCDTTGYQPDFFEDMFYTYISFISKVYVLDLSTGYTVEVQPDPAAFQRHYEPMRSNIVNVPHVFNALFQLRDQFCAGQWDQSSMDTFTIAQAADILENEQFRKDPFQLKDYVYNASTRIVVPRALHPPPPMPAGAVGEDIIWSNDVYGSHNDEAFNNQEDPMIQFNPGYPQNVFLNPGTAPKWMQKDTSVSYLSPPYEAYADGPAIDAAGNTYGFNCSMCFDHDWVQQQPPIFQSTCTNAATISAPNVCKCSKTSAGKFMPSAPYTAATGVSTCEVREGHTRVPLSPNNARFEMYSARTNGTIESEWCYIEGYPSDVKECEDSLYGSPDYNYARSVDPRCGLDPTNPNLNPLSSDPSRGCFNWNDYSPFPRNSPKWNSSAANDPLKPWCRLPRDNVHTPPFCKYGWSQDPTMALTSASVTAPRLPWKRILMDAVAYIMPSNGTLTMKDYCVNMGMCEPANIQTYNEGAYDGVDLKCAMRGVISGTSGRSLMQTFIQGSVFDPHQLILVFCAIAGFFCFVLICLVSIIWRDMLRYKRQQAELDRTTLSQTLLSRESPI